MKSSMTVQKARMTLKSPCARLATCLFCDLGFLLQGQRHQFVSNAAVPVTFRLMCLHKNKHEAVDSVSTVSKSEHFCITTVTR